METHIARKVGRLVGWLGGLALAAGAVRTEAVTTIFSDPITNWTVGSEYVLNQPQLHYSQYNGGGALVVTNDGPFNAGPGNQFAQVFSGAYAAYSTMTHTDNVTDRYGQVFLRFADPSPSAQWVRMAVSTNDTVLFANSEGVTGNGVGPDVMLDPNGLVRYFSGAAEVVTSVAYPTTQLFNITLNYDQLLGTYDVWADTNLVASGIPFESPGGGTMRSLALGAAFWSYNTYPALDQWYWKSDNAAPFTTFGNEIPESMTVGLLVLGSAFLWIVRRNRG